VKLLLNIGNKKPKKSAHYNGGVYHKTLLVQQGGFFRISLLLLMARLWQLMVELF